ncbi:MAG: O-antigen ligase family protein, partial [bacterium]
LLTGGNYLYNIVNPGNIKEAMSTGTAGFEGSGIRYGPNGFTISLMIFIFSLSYIFISRQRNYFLAAAISAFIIVIASATRAWFVAYSIALLFFIYYNSRSLKNTFAIGIVSVLLLLPIIYSTTGSLVFTGAYDRLSTVYTIGEEHSAATQQLEAKATRRLPRQLDYIADNPITGWAFTERRGDPDVGNFALIVDVGFVGFFIFLAFWIKYIYVLRGHIKTFKLRSSRNSLKMLIIGFLGILLNHFTTNGWFIIYNGVFIGLFVFISEFIIEEVKSYEEKQRALKYHT